MEEARERQNRLAKMRALLFYHEAKARRLKKIKSKEYRRKLKKAGGRGGTRGLCGDVVGEDRKQGVPAQAQASSWVVLGRWCGWCGGKTEGRENGHGKGGVFFGQLGFGGLDEQCSASASRPSGWASVLLPAWEPWGAGSKQPASPAVCRAVAAAGRRGSDGCALPVPHAPCCPAEKRKAEAGGGGEEGEEEELRLMQEQAEFDRAKVGNAARSLLLPLTPTPPLLLWSATACSPASRPGQACMLPA